jgi:hypothetical protein
MNQHKCLQLQNTERVRVVLAAIEDGRWLLYEPWTNLADHQLRQQVEHILDVQAEYLGEDRQRCIRSEADTSALELWSIAARSPPATRVFLLPLCGKLGGTPE